LEEDVYNQYNMIFGTGIQIVPGGIQRWVFLAVSCIVVVFAFILAKMAIAINAAYVFDFIVWLATI
jgi:hypothetical protein